MTKRPEIAPVDTQRVEDEGSKLKGITGEQAVEIAKTEALKTYESLDGFKVVICEQEIFWRVIYDGGGAEYLIDKLSGRIIRAQKTPQGTKVSDPKGASTTNRSVSEAEAIAIAKRDMSSPTNRESFDSYVVHSCELDRAWRIIIETKIRLRPNENVPVIPNASTPNYVIDKASGKILFKQRG